MAAVSLACGFPWPDSSHSGGGLPCGSARGRPSPRLEHRKVIIAPDGGDAWAPAKPRPDETLIRALARAHWWKGMLEDGTHASIDTLAEAEKINRAYVCRLLNMTPLAPGVVEAILDGRQPKGMMLDELVRTIHSEWAEQHRIFGLC